jgi:hypothetical protein
MDGVNLGVIFDSQLSFEAHIKSQVFPSTEHCQVTTHAITTCSGATHPCL